MPTNVTNRSGKPHFEGSGWCRLLLREPVSSNMHEVEQTRGGSQPHQELCLRLAVDHTQDHIDRNDCRLAILIINDDSDSPWIDNISTISVSCVFSNIIGQENIHVCNRYPGPEILQSYAIRAHHINLQSGRPSFISLVACSASNSSASKSPPHSIKWLCCSSSGSASAFRNR